MRISTRTLSVAILLSFASLLTQNSELSAQDFESSTTEPSNLIDEEFASEAERDKTEILLLEQSPKLTHLEEFPLSGHLSDASKEELEDRGETLESIDIIEDWGRDAIKPTIEGQFLFSQSNNETPAGTNEEDWPEPIDDSQTFWLLLFDQLEYRASDGENSFNWDILSWVGGDYERLWIKSEGEVGVETGEGEAELQLLYGKLIRPFWDLQVGVRYEQLYGSEGSPGRVFGVIGVQGVTPYLVELDAALFVSHEGDISARLTAEYPLLLSQRWILQPEFETNIALQTVEEFGVGSGINDIELGLRLRYEFSRQFAPYIGINWTRKLGNTASLARAEGDRASNFSVVGGIRLLF